MEKHQFRSISMLFLLPIFLVSISGANQSDFNSYLGGWSGDLQHPDVFKFEIELKKSSTDEFAISFKGQTSVTSIPLVTQGEKYLRGHFKDQLSITIDPNAKELPTFFQVGHHICYINWQQKDQNTWKTSWNLLLAEKAKPTFYLALEQGNDSSYYASSYFKAPSFHYMYGIDLTIEDSSFSFKDLRSQIHFQGTLLPQMISLDLRFLNEHHQIDLIPTDYDNWRIGESNLATTDQITILKSDDRFTNLIQDIQSDTLGGTHSVVVMHKGNIVFESYFDGMQPSTPHDTRSMSKTFGSTMIGFAIDEGLLPNEHVSIKPYFEKDYPTVAWSNEKDAVTIYNLLCMNSGMDINDSGSSSHASEGVYQNQEDWTGHILSAPMVNPVGKIANYGSGSPHLLGPIIEGQLDERMEFYIHRKLFGPLGITNYRIQANNKDQPYFGGGWYLTSRDLLKFGQLYVNEGNWEGKQILSKEWVKKSLAKHSLLANTRNKNEYGYLLWHDTYQVKGQKISSIEGRGNGGQYVFIIPELELAAVVTAGNYRSRKTAQPERIMEEYILPHFVKN